MRSITRLHLTGALAGSLLLPACGDAVSEGLVSLGVSEQALIGGFHAPSPRLDHTGALVTFDPRSGVVEPFCTGTLIGDATVVTAKHCVQDLVGFERAGLELHFALGADADAPRELVPIAAAEGAPGDEGGFLGVGRDVGVVHLDVVPGVAAAEPRAFDASFEGVRLISIGYGFFGASGASDGRRRIGRETVAATSGRVLEILFGDFESFVEWFFEREVSAVDYLALMSGDAEVQAALPRLVQQYEGIELLAEHEAVTGLAATDTQTCLGDSGGPMLLVGPSGGFEVYGVVSSGLSSRRLFCDFGTIIATFGPATLPFLEAARDWVDPCGEVGPAGVCEGDVVRRCETSFADGVRALGEQDCAELGQRCVASAGGAACASEPAALE